MTYCPCALLQDARILDLEATAAAAKTQLAAAVSLVETGRARSSSSQAALDSAVVSLVELRTELSAVTEKLAIVTGVSVFGVCEHGGGGGESH